MVCEQLERLHSGEDPPPYPLCAEGPEAGSEMRSKAGLSCLVSAGLVFFCLAILSSSRTQWVVISLETRLQKKAARPSD